MTISCAPCTEPSPAYSVGVFRLEVRRDDEPARDVGNVVVGTIREIIERFEGCPANATVIDRRLAYQVRQAIEVVAQMDELTCENFRDWLVGPAVNVVAGTQIQLQAVQASPIFRLVLRHEICEGTTLSLVIHRAYIVSELDVLFSSEAFSGQQLVFRALRDPDHPTNLYGYLEITGSCGSS